MYGILAAWMSAGMRITLANTLSIIYAAPLTFVTCAAANILLFSADNMLDLQKYVFDDAATVATAPSHMVLPTATLTYEVFAKEMQQNLVQKQHGHHFPGCKNGNGIGHMDVQGSCCWLHSGVQGVQAGRGLMLFMAFRGLNDFIPYFDDSAVACYSKNSNMTAAQACLQGQHRCNALLLALKLQPSGHFELQICFVCQNSSLMHL